MKKLSKLVLVIFSVIILIIGVAINLLVVGWLDYNTAFSLIKYALTQDPSNKIILIVLSLISMIILFLRKENERNREGNEVNPKCWTL